MRLASRLRIALCLVSMFPALAVTLASTPASALTCTGTWQVVPTPNPGPTNNQLLGVDAVRRVGRGCELRIERRPDHPSLGRLGLVVRAARGWQHRHPFPRRRCRAQ